MVRLKLEKSIESYIKMDDLLKVQILELLQHKLSINATKKFNGYDAEYVEIELLLDDKVISYATINLTQGSSLNIKSPNNSAVE